ncbi:baculoviral IAP repeat-containing protein 7-like isoform X2 [Ylistrum balloti]|nr:baculoviral IAP repeat-containing protein 7-like isoform X2 [Ylistrum balloti]
MLMVETLGRHVAPPPPRERYRHLRVKETRRESYRYWPKSDRLKEDLIDEGFFYLGEQDRVQCAFCGGVLHSFEENENVHIEHYRHFPRCQTFEETETAMEGALFGYMSDTQTDGPGDEGLDQGVVELMRKMDLSSVKKHPKHKYYALLKDRLKTFENSEWPADHPMDKEELAKAGLFYAGVGDLCECYCCGGQLEEFEEGDIPVEEHDKYFSDICVLAMIRKTK